MSNNLAQSPIKVSSNKQDFIQEQLSRYIIALALLEKYGLIEDFKRAIKGGANLPTEAIFGEVVIETR